MQISIDEHTAVCYFKAILKQHGQRSFKFERLVYCMSKEHLYNERVELFKTTVNHQEPLRVPILSTYETWVFSYANSYVKELDENPEKEIEIYSKPYEDIYTDGIYTSGLAFDAKSANILGSPSHFISEDGQTVQHKEITPMLVEEYP